MRDVLDLFNESRKTLELLKTVGTFNRLEKLIQDREVKNISGKHYLVYNILDNPHLVYLGEDGKEYTCTILQIMEAPYAESGKALLVKIKGKGYDARKKYTVGEYEVRPKELGIPLGRGQTGFRYPRVTYI